MEGEEFHEVEIDQKFYTLIPSRFPTIDPFARIAKSRSREIADIESITNPRLRERNRMTQGASAVDGNSPLLQNWNHAPFTYSNPEGSRFFGPERSVLELAEDLQTALAISIRRRETFLRRTGEAAIGLEMREITRVVKGRFADGRDWDLDLNLEERRRRGELVMRAGFDGLLFRSEERPSGTCICVIRGEVLERAVQGDHFKFVWDGEAVTAIYSFRSGQDFLPEKLRSADRVLA